MTQRKNGPQTETWQAAGDRGQNERRSFFSLHHFANRPTFKNNPGGQRLAPNAPGVWRPAQPRRSWSGKLTFLQQIFFSDIPGDLSQIIPELMPAPIEFADGGLWEFGGIKRQMGKGHNFVVAAVIEENVRDA